MDDSISFAYSREAKVAGSSMNHITNPNAADCSDKTNYRTYRKVNVTSCQDTQQHTGCQHEYVSIL